MHSLQESAALETIYARITRQAYNQFSLCSTQHDAGNSAAALALAKRAAQSGKRVLLIELTPTHPTLAQQYHLPATEWLPLTGNWEHAAQESDQPGLMLLSCPEKASHCVEFRDQDTLKLFFESCLQRFDWVICDTEPLLVSERKIDQQNYNCDSLPVDTICAASAATLLNVVTGRTTESQIDEAKETLDSCGAKLRGVIMNDRYAPSLKQELIRETYRFDRFMPKLMARFRQKLETMILLNQEL